MASFLANEVNATDRDVTGLTEQVQIMFTSKDKNVNNYAGHLKPFFKESRTLCDITHRTGK